uniref:Uncharacterized protein n=1 Tax=Knipowitschia caucasica TaxID=637954 RepID=A0AAV2J0U7_KNICA
MLQKLAASIKEDVEEVSGDDASAVELYDFIMEFVRSDKLMSLEDEGMSSLLILNDLILELQQRPKANEAELIQSAEETAEPQVGPAVIQMDSQQSISSQGSEASV